MDRKSRGITPLEILKHLNKSNCRECGLPACLAFAAAVVKGEKKFSDCPHLSKETRNRLDARLVTRGSDRRLEELIEPLMERVRTVDLKEAASRLGGDYTDGRLRIKCLGKDFLIDKKGNVESMIHINTWVVAPLLHYIVKGGEGPLSGRWVSFEDLKKASTVTQYFDRRCEEPMRQLAESHTDIFFDLLNIFGARGIKGFSADYARVLHPLPKVPFLILYWRPEDQFESKLKILLDSSADRYLDIEYIIALGRGMVEMFKKILSRHDELMPALLSL